MLKNSDNRYVSMALRSTEGVSGNVGSGMQTEEIMSLHGQIQRDMLYSEPLNVVVESRRSFKTMRLDILRGRLLQLTNSDRY